MLRKFAVIALVPAAVLASLSIEPVRASSRARVSIRQPWDDVPGIRVITSRATPRPLSDNQKDALGAATAFARKHGGDMAPPFIDLDAEGALVTPVVKGARRSLATVSAAKGRSLGLPVQNPIVRYSYKALRKMQDDVTDLTESQVPGVRTIYTVSIDEKTDRVLLCTGIAPTRTLLRGLVDRFGHDAMTILYEEGSSGGMPARSRDADSAPFIGGATIVPVDGKCTTGFSYRIKKTKYMLTAGHCISEGGTVTNPTPKTLGKVSSGRRETWRDGEGTVPLTGETGIYGDLALIKTSGRGGSWPGIFAEGVNSSSVRPVKRVDFTYEGDNHCTGGAFAGEVCGWVVDELEATHIYDNGEVARNVAISFKRGHCGKKGDSGGPVYYVPEDGSVRAKGIISGNGGGGKDAFAGRLEHRCRLEFTDIWRAVDAWHGEVMTQ